MLVAAVVVLIVLIVVIVLVGIVVIVLFGIVAVMKASSFIYANHVPLLFPDSNPPPCRAHYPSTHSSPARCQLVCALFCALFVHCLLLLFPILCTFNICNCAIVVRPLC